MSNRNRTSILHIKKNNKGKSYYKAPIYPEIPLTKEDIYVITIAGDRLDLLAYQFYKDIRLWWVIANANRDIIRRDSYSLKGGLEIRIPSLTESTLEKFKELNRTINY
jgi:nucleoid-associated protein YgaU